jgi:hypothetical protein
MKMNAWIMLVDPNRVSVFRASSNRTDIIFSKVIRNLGRTRTQEESPQISDHFANYIAEEIEIACGCGTDSSLIISGESVDVHKVCNCLSSDVKKHIIGIIPKGYNPDLWKEVLVHYEHKGSVPQAVG